MYLKLIFKYIFNSILTIFHEEFKMSGTWGHIYTLTVKVNQEPLDINLLDCQCFMRPTLTPQEILTFWNDALQKNWAELTIDLISITEEGHLEFHIFTMEHPTIFVQALLNPSNGYLTKDMHNIKLTGELVKITGV